MPLLIKKHFNLVGISFLLQLSVNKKSKFGKLRSFANKMYSVSETNEDGKVCVTRHPSIWVNDGILLWPPPGSGVKINEIIAPGSDWIQYKCRVLRENISNYRFCYFCVIPRSGKFKFEISVLLNDFKTRLHLFSSLSV